MADLRIERVQTPSEKQRFLTFPWKIYRDDPLWVPPLLPERRNQIDPEHSPFLKRGEADFFLAYQGDQLVGTICAAEDPPTNRNRGTQECVFWFFEYIEDYEVFQALVETAKDWGRKRGWIDYGCALPGTLYERTKMAAGASCFRLHRGGQPGR